ncbi:phosphodiesterase [Streptomyces cavernicola]|uniref:Phosphodiesterase n=1 Tax=Streptomyces cavernicola TaxID=3043613 RepID=A0ABT6S2G2_9ACTN|nr:phosphodiesterase [Streptomyces sp. B-S-A6]MDI3402288.1 phosphodiesterase [Streptomyces sp. B-S-A6]
MLVLAQISDLHLDGTPRATERAERVMDRLRGLHARVDALLVTGDIADHGTEDEYEEAARILQAPFPVLTCPGNHDVRARYRKALLGLADAQRPDAPVNSVHRIGGAAVLMCDSSIPGRDDGLLAPETYAWIDATLDDLGAELPTLLAFHHPPVALHHPLPDAYPLRQPDALADLLDRRPQVKGVVTGHAHSPGATVFAGRPLVVGPGVTWTLQLPWESPEVADRAADPGLAFHVLDDEGRLLTHFRSVQAG